MTEKQRQAERLIDEMLSAQSRFAVQHDDRPPNEQQRRDEVKRDEARVELMEMIRE